MSVKTTLRQVIERNEAQAQQNIELYYSTVASLVEGTGNVVAKLPAGEKIASRYVELASKATGLQKDALLKLLATQARIQTWPLGQDQPARKPAAKSAS